jgi:hypothetical protein
VKLESIVTLYSQEADSCAPINTEYCELSIEITDAGGGPYAVIKTERWALDADAIDAFAAELKRRIAEVEATA